MYFLSYKENCVASNQQEGLVVRMCKPYDLSSIPKTPIKVKAKDHVYEVYSDLNIHIFAHSLTHPYPHMMMMMIN